MPEQKCLVEPIFRDWPQKSILSIYHLNGRRRSRKKAKKFDISDEAFGGWWPMTSIFYFGVQVSKKSFGRWDDMKLRKCEDNIAYDLSFDGYIPKIYRVKGIGLKGKEEALWRVIVRF